MRNRRKKKGGGEAKGGNENNLNPKASKQKTIPMIDTRLNFADFLLNIFITFI